MKIATRKNKGSCKMRIEGEMNIYAAQELKVRLLDCLHNSLRLDLDLSKVSEIDTAGFQLLILAKREAGFLNKGFRILAHSEATSGMTGLLNMTGYFEEKDGAGNGSRLEKEREA